MISIYEPLDHYQKKERYAIFLAGGIKSAPNWQKDAISYIKEKYNHLEIDILNPRRKEKFSDDDYDARLDQVKWEFRNLRQADVILFWFPEKAPCTTTLFELGYWLNFSNVVVGVNPGHYKEKSVKTQIDLLNKSRIGVKIKVVSTLEETLDNAITFLNKRYDL